MQNVQSDCAALRIQCEQLERIKDENYRLNGVDQELKRAKQVISDNEDSYRRLKDQIVDLESHLGSKTVELQAKDEAIRQIDIDVKEMQS